MLRPHRFLPAIVVTVAMLMASLVTTPAGAAEAQRITVDGGSGGRTYDGIGALSAGASSRLLIDYPEPQRSQILDYLFKPGYGAALQILKVEIGGDTNSTDGAEPSHMRTPSDLNCDRGYEWWLMEEAKKRNPNIVLSALQWGAPNWTGDDSGARPTVWTQANADYLVSWLDCARRHDLRINYLGGWNEAGFNAAYYEKLRATLDAHGYGDIKVVADDSFSWNVVQPLTDDPAFRDAVDVVGQHYVCGYLSGALHCPSPDAAQALGKPLQASEQGSLPFDSGAVPLARAMNRQYIDGAITGTVNWSLIASWYDTMPFQAAGLMGAVEPWSGAYDVGASIWVMAHTAQFTQPGWRYVDSAKGYLSGGGSYVALRSPTGGDYSLIAETVDAAEPQQVSLDVTGLPDKSLHMWQTDLTSGSSRDWFVRDRDVRPGDTITLQPGRIYSLSTTTGQGKGTAVSPPPRPQALPYRESFDTYAAGRTPRYISDLDGAFETAPCAGRSGTCLRQQITSLPVWWNGWLKKPVTLVGDLKSWRDYTATVDARPEPGGWTELLGRVDGQFGNAVSGVHLRLASDGTWRLYDENLRGQDGELCQPSDPSCAPASGPLARNGRTFGPRPGTPRDSTLATGQVGEANGWHRLALTFSGTHLIALIDGKQVASVEAPVHAGGQVGLGVSPWQTAEFDNLQVDPAPTPGNVRYLNAQELSATTTSFHHGYEARKAVDGSVQSMWHTEWDPKPSLPQSITVDTGTVRKPVLVTYQPREDGNGNGIITKYELARSVDGIHFTTAATGTWPSTLDRKTITLNGAPARYLRLTAIDAGGGYASTAEIQVAVPR